MFHTPPTLNGAICHDLPASEKQIFFAGGGAFKKAKALCNECPVKDQCLSRALSFEKPGEKRHGIWGGMTPNERKREFDGQAV